MGESKKNLDLEDIALQVRQQVVLAALRSGSGHIASALSMVELLTYLFFEKLELDLESPAKGDSFVPEGPRRPVFVCSATVAGIDLPRAYGIVP